MNLGILQNGIVQRHDDGTSTIVRPGRLGGAFTEIEVSEELADTYRLATGDVVEGTTEPIALSALEPEPEAASRWEEEEDEWQWDEPAAVRNERLPAQPTTPTFPTEELMTVTRINGLTLEEAEERPSPRTRRSHSERTPPDRLLTLAVGPEDTTGRVLDFAAPLGAGYFGVIQGPHGSGLTRTLRSVVQGIVTNAPDCVVTRRDSSGPISPRRR